LITGNQQLRIEELTSGVRTIQNLTVNNRVVKEQKSCASAVTPTDTAAFTSAPTIRYISEITAVTSSEEDVSMYNKVVSTTGW
jgi:hypothetical protein